MNKKAEDIGNDLTNFINKQNRPYSANDVCNFFQKDYGKTLVVRTLENLANKKLIIEKIYGKQKVYLPDQEKLPIIPQNEIKEFDDNIQSLNLKIDESKNSIKNLEIELKNLEASLTFKDAQILMGKLEKEKSLLKIKLEASKENKILIPIEEKNKIFSKNKLLQQEFKKRRKIVVTILDTILENYPKTKNQLLEDIGIEDMPDI